MPRVLCVVFLPFLSFFFFFNDTATTEIYTLSLHDALPISEFAWSRCGPRFDLARAGFDPAHLNRRAASNGRDRKSTRLNSSHGYISYAVFCLKKKTNKTKRYTKMTCNGY